MIRISVMLFILMTALPFFASADDTVQVPWSEFKALYRESVEKEVMARFPDSPATMRYGIDAAVYTITVDNSRARGSAHISGRVLSGELAAVPLFSGDIILDAVSQSSGGVLLGDTEAAGATVFMPDGIGPFELAVDFVAPVEEDTISRLFSFRIPTALRNALHLKMAPDMEIVETPGITKNDGSIHFAASTQVTVRFSEKEHPLSKRPAHADLFTEIAIEREKTVITAAIMPLRGLPASYLLTVPKGFRYAAPPPSGIKVSPQDNATLRVHMGKAAQVPGHITLVRDEMPDEGQSSLRLPGILNNRGRQNDFIIHQPDDGEIVFSNPNMISAVPAARLHPKFRARVTAQGSFYHATPNTDMDYSVIRYQPMATPPLVLDTISFYSVFEENGHTLSLLSMEVPPQAGRRLAIQAVPDSKIWWLKVNGENRQLYIGDNDEWIVPLSAGHTSLIEVAFLREGSPMGLSGRLETVLPATGLPARQVHVCIALPERVQFTAMEGPLMPDEPIDAPLPREVTGAPYFFSHTFYQGSPIHLAVSYKEPVREESRPGIPENSDGEI